MSERLLLEVFGFERVYNVLQLLLLRTFFCLSVWSGFGGIARRWGYGRRKIMGDMARGWGWGRGTVMMVVGWRGVFWGPGEGLLYIHIPQITIKYYRGIYIYAILGFCGFGF